MGIKDLLNDLFYYGKKGFFKLLPLYAIVGSTALFIAAAVISIYSTAGGLAVFVVALMWSCILTGYLQGR